MSKYKSVWIVQAKDKNNKWFTCLNGSAKYSGAEQGYFFWHKKDAEDYKYLKLLYNPKMTLRIKKFVQE